MNGGTIEAADTGWLMQGIPPIDREFDDRDVDKTHKRKNGRGPARFL